MKLRPFLLLLLLLPLCALGQNTSLPAPQQFTLRFVGQKGESFSVYLDGELQNRMPQSNVIVNHVSDQVHEVVVVLKRPADKCAVLHLLPSDRTVDINVSYDFRLEQMHLFTAAHNRANRDQSMVQSSQTFRSAEPRYIEPLPHSDFQATPARVVPTSDMMASMLSRLRSQSFERDRLALAKVLVAATPMLASQLAQIVATLDFSNSQVELLKHAYPYCLDPEAYDVAINTLTFSTDRRKVRDFIATLD